MRKQVLVLIGLLGCAGALPATMIVRDYQAPLHDRFYSGADKDFIGEPYSFSGVGFSTDGRWATLIADNYFISATHYHPAIGSSVTFWESNLSGGPNAAYTVAGGQQIGSTDLWVGWFNTPVSADFTRYAVLELAMPTDYLGQVLYNYGSSHLVGRNVSDQLLLASEGGSTGWTLWFDYDNNDTPSVAGDETFLQPGDSGAPTFRVVNGQLALVGIHWAIDVTASSTNSVDTLVSYYTGDINTVLATQSQALTIVPEPSSAAFVILGGLLVWTATRSKRG